MLLITGSKWIDVIAEQVHDGDWAVLESGVFERAESSPLDNACPRLDARGMCLVPGLIDAHVHLGRPRAPSPVEQLPLDRHVEQVARATLAGGITTVRDLGDRWPRGKHVAAAARKLKGPHVVSALAGITAPGGYGAFLGEATRDKDDLMRAVRRRHEAGASVIKLFLTGGVDFASSAVSAPQFEYDTLSLAAAAARERGMMLAVHANGAEAVLLAVRAGADTIEHGLLIDGDGLRAMADKGVYWIPTLAPLRRALDLGGDGPLLAGLRVVLRRHMEAVARGYDLGVKVVAGTDAGAPGVAHGCLAGEVALLREAGLPPGAAIRAATAWAAESLGIGAETGQIKAGYSADFLLLRENPLRDVAALARIYCVGARGSAIAL